jgi:hypothetical protein
MKEERFSEAVTVALRKSGKTERKRKCEQETWKEDIIGNLAATIEG